ncbi:MAG TPA: hypothetical protein VE077_20075 [Candidatus Methylomirabilis sp.]|nr:hypothetical protein [Candidatus Methylomirabilis sp.]
MDGRRGALVVAGVETGEILAAYEMDVAAHRLARPGSVPEKVFGSRLFWQRVSQ